jgi:hypothetical protein
MGIYLMSIVILHVSGLLTGGGSAAWTGESLLLDGHVIDGHFMLKKVADYFNYLNIHKIIK